jgi:hypothetical protein
MADKLTKVRDVASYTVLGGDGPDDSEEDRERGPDQGEDETT